MTASRRSDVVARMRQARRRSFAALLDPIVFCIADAVVVKCRPNGAVMVPCVTVREADKAKIAVNGPAKSVRCF